MDFFVHLQTETKTQNMNKKFSLLLLISIFSTLTINAEVYEGSCGDNASYSLNTSTGVFSITGTGAMNDYSSSSSVPWYSQRSYIKTVSIAYGITSIGNCAFYDCSKLTSVTIPNSVTSIGELAFYSCSSLKSITIPNNVTSIGGSAFQSCSSLTSITIPNSITTIKGYVFNGCSSLKSITIPQNVTSIGSSAFQSCSSLTSVTIGDKVVSIGTNAFSDCKTLKSFTIPQSVKTLDNYAFQNCSSLTSVEIPYSVRTIGYYVFRNCTSLTKVVLNSNTIASKSYSVGNSFKYVFGSQLKEFILGKDVTSIGESAFYDCSGLTSVTIGNNVTSIGKSAFANCSSLKSITIPKNVTSIGSWAFAGCSNLTSANITDIAAWCKISFNSGDSNPLFYAKHIFMNGKEIKNLVIPDNVTKIGNYAFNGCSGLISVTIGNAVTSIGESAFSECTSLTDIYCHVENVPTTGSNVFKNTNMSNITLHIPSASTSSYKGIAPWSDFGTIKSISVGEICFVDSIYYKMINKAKQAIVISGGNYTGKVVIPDTIKYKGVTYSVTSIEENAFKYCSTLTSVVLPVSVKSIGNMAFLGCSELTDVYCYAENVPTTENDAFADSYIEYITLHVPESSISEYKTTSPWSGFGTIKTIPVETPETPKCATPTINYENGILTFNCDTEGVEYHYDYYSSDSGSGIDDKVIIPQARNITINVYATKNGYQQSDTVTKEIDLGTAGLRGDLNGDGVVNMPDAMFIVNKVLKGKFPDE
ncbi:MAG: leucine-rich repeat domain-containing protein [Prevotella sp.]|nr:leucine-rich repeat domain-containing protein [Prevotella sp.]